MKKIILTLLPFIISCSRSGNTVNPVRKDIIETVYASGKIIPENEYHVFAMANGTVVSKPVKEGDAVETGTIIYKISNEAPEARLNAARSLLQHSQTNVSPQSRVLNELKLNMESAAAKYSNDSLTYYRTKNLYDNSAASKSSLDNAYMLYTLSLNQKKSSEERYFATMNDLQVALQNAKGQAATAQTDADNYLIRSGSNATVFQLLKEEGEAVHAGEIVALLGDRSKRIIKLSVDQQDIDKIRSGQDVLLKSDVSGNKVFHAIVTQVYPVMNEIDQTFRVDATFADSVDQPFVHSSVEANIIIQQKKNALIVPSAAMTSEDSLQVKSEGKVKNIFIHTGIRTLDDVEVIDGIDESAEVVIPVQK